MRLPQALHLLKLSIQLTVQKGSNVVCFETAGLRRLRQACLLLPCRLWRGRAVVARHLLIRRSREGRARRKRRGRGREPIRMGRW